MYPGQELVFTETMTGSGNTYIGMRNADDTAWVRWVGFDGTKISATNEGFDIATNYSTGYTVNNKLIAMRYDHGDNKLKWYDIDTTGVETLITSATTACDGNAIRISASGNNRVPQSPVLRYYGWEFVHAAASTPQTWHNWRCDRPSINSSIRIDTALRSRRALIPGYYMRWRTGLTAPNFFMGQWKSSNGASGLSNIEATHSYWDWGWKGVNTERIRALLGMTFNTSNANYNAGGGDPYWADPDPGTTEIQWRYNSDNSIDLYDFTNSAIIATKDVDGDGNGIYLTFATGSGITTVQLADDFLGGGDVTFGTI
jgi:hypothetical protein